VEQMTTAAGVAARRVAKGSPTHLPVATVRPRETAAPTER
jgi:hypothetical protein